MRRSAGRAARVAVLRRRFDDSMPKIETAENRMAKIKLRDDYPFYSLDAFVDAPDEVIAVLLEAKRRGKAYRRRDQDLHPRYGYPYP